MSARLDKSPVIAPLTFALLTLIALGDGLFVSSSRVIGSPDGDLTMQFISWREFGFSQLSQGNLPLWNPHVFGGAPFFAGFQSALLYPPNWLHLLLPMGPAISWIIAAHVFAAGYFTYFWCRRRASIVASIVGGAMFMFCGPYFSHIFAGHLPHIAVIVWIPLIFLSIDGLIEASRAIKSWLLGTIAIAMQILAGHPQYVYYTAIVATIYFSIRWIERRTNVKRIALFAATYLAAACISAIQLLPGIAAANLTVRTGGLSIGMAGTFSLSPENLLTAAVPFAFGHLDLAASAADAGEKYFARGYLWENSVFIGVTGLTLAAIGAVCSEHKRLRWILLAMIAICLTLALGRHTPMYPLMYQIVPKYNSFRGTVKFAAPAAAFASMLAAIGFDRIVAARDSRAPLFVAGIVALALAIVAMTIQISSHTGSAGPWGSVLGTIASSRATGGENENFTDLTISDYSDTSVIAQTGRVAAGRTAIAASIATAIAALVFAGKYRRAMIYLVPAIAIIELLIFARASMATTSVHPQIPQTWLDAIARNISVRPDARVLVVPVQQQNAGMIFGFDDLWGYDPGVLKRYAELLAFSQGDNPDKAAQYLMFRHPSMNIFQALRCNLVLLDDRRQPWQELPIRPLPTALLLRNYQVITEGRDAALAAITSDQFDPATTALLESPPDPMPVKGDSIGDVIIARQTTDSLELRVNLDTPAILLITNNFTPEWRARSLDFPAPQDHYTIQPANWTQQAIALAAGKHHLLIEYAPLSFRIGRWISLISLIGCGWLFLRSRGAK